MCVAPRVLAPPLGPRPKKKALSAPQAVAAIKQLLDNARHTGNARHDGI